MSVLTGRSRPILAACGAILALAYGWQASSLRLPAFSDPMGPRTVPYLVAGGLLLACLALMVEHVATRARAEATERPTLVAAGTVALLAAYFGVLEPLGFVPASALFLVVFLSLTNRGRVATNVAVAVAFPVAAHVVLVMLLGARLPAGLLAGG